MYTNTAINQKIDLPFLSETEVWIKRLDKLNQEATGNKIFKLKYNLEAAKASGLNKILTFGGAFSNHIAAVAVEGKKHNINTIGIIRGEELGEDLAATLRYNPTLKLAYQNGMQFDFVSRSDYRQKDSDEFLNRLRQKYGDFYVLPEGGTNALAVKGCKEILTKADQKFDVIACPVGTGGTIAGLINSSLEYQKVLGFSALNADLTTQVQRLTVKSNWKLIKESYFGGFAKINRELVSFINDYFNKGIPLDPIYTSKMMFRLIEMIRNDYFCQPKRILVIHTGGLQGVFGMNKVLEKRQLPLIKCYKK